MKAALYSSILVLGGLFYLGQCIWRRVADMGLKKRYQENKCFLLNVKKLLALAFVPVSDVIKAFELITDELNDDDREKLLDYFEPT